jgi:hypothetical protein
MSAADPTILQAVQSYLDRLKLKYEAVEEQFCTRLVVKNGPTVVPVSVYNSGKIVVGGKDSPLRKQLRRMQSGVEGGELVPGQELPFEIERFPEAIRERAADCEPVIIAFVEEAIRSFKAEAYLGTAFMLGAASERAVNTLIEVYADSMQNPKNKEKFLSRINGRMISRKYEEFERSYAGCQNKPTDAVLSQDLDVIIGNIFQFARITRNEIGHPEIVPDLDKGVLLANLGNFVNYIGRIYGLMKHFRDNGVVV